MATATHDDKFIDPDPYYSGKDLESRFSIPLSDTTLATTRGLLASADVGSATIYRGWDVINWLNNGGNRSLRG